MREIDDKGFINEIDLISDFYPNGKAQLTAPPSIEFNNGEVSVSCETPGARIGYRFTSEKAAYLGWNHYSIPLIEREGDTLEIITHRLGFKYGITSVFNGKQLKTFYPANSHDD